MRWDAGCGVGEGDGEAPARPVPRSGSMTHLACAAPFGPRLLLVVEYLSVCVCVCVSGSGGGGRESHQRNGWPYQPGQAAVSHGDRCEHEGGQSQGRGVRTGPHAHLRSQQEPARRPSPLLMHLHTCRMARCTLAIVGFAPRTFTSGVLPVATKTRRILGSSTTGLEWYGRHAPRAPPPLRYHRRCTTHTSCAPDYAQAEASCGGEGMGCG